MNLHSNQTAGSHTHVILDHLNVFEFSQTLILHVVGFALFPNSSIRPRTPSKETWMRGKLGFNANLLMVSGCSLNQNELFTITQRNCYKSHYPTDFLKDCWVGSAQMLLTTQVLNSLCSSFCGSKTFAKSLDLPM